MTTAGYDFWLFDLDGTLVDVEPAYRRELLTDVGDRLGVAFADHETTHVWHGSEATRREILERKGLTPREFWTTFDEADDRAARVEATFLYEDARVVGGLEEPVGLVTHCPAHVTDRVLDHLDIRDWFDDVVCCDEEIGWKPDPAPLRAAMSGLGVGVGTGGNGTGGAGTDASADADGASGVYAGDGPHDIGAAWNAGLAGIHVDRHDASLRGEYVTADRQVRVFTDLLA